MIVTLDSKSEPGFESLPGLCHVHGKDTATMSLRLLVLFFSLEDMAGIYKVRYF